MDEIKKGLPTINITFENLSELKQLLQEATDQLEQFEKTLIKINQFKVVTKSSKS